MALTSPKSSATPRSATTPPSISTDGTMAAVIAMAAAVTSQATSNGFHMRGSSDSCGDFQPNLGSGVGLGIHLARVSVI